MAQNITLLGANYSAVPSVVLPKTGGGSASFTDVTDTTAAAADVASGKYFYTAAGVRTQGTASGGGGLQEYTNNNTDGGSGEVYVYLPNNLTCLDLANGFENRTIKAIYLRNVYIGDLDVREPIVPLLCSNPDAFGISLNGWVYGLLPDDDADYIEMAYLMDFNGDAYRIDAIDGITVIM